jgi:protein phosphatase
MMRITAAGRSDVGRIRHANEDAFHVGDSVFAVADGMGGHLAGEVASTTALEPIARLDGRVFADAPAATSALVDAVVAANDVVAGKAADDPSFRGMGTTLTAVMVEGRRGHLAHVGDSRAYLLRDGAFDQITTDHTLVQRLIEEGRLTRDEAAQHPQRSVITRAIGVEQAVDVDAAVLELDPGDVLLLCSDGLTGPVDDEVIAQTLRDTAPVDDAARRLVELALEGGGPDNVTVVILRFGELETAPAPRHNATMQVRTVPGDAATRRPGRLRPWAHDGRDDDRYPEIDGDAPDDADRPASRRQRWVIGAVAVALLAAVVLAGGRLLLSQSYYVGAARGGVVIFQGVPVDLGPVPLSWEHEETSLAVDDVPVLQRDEVIDGMAASDLADARRIVANFAARAAMTSPSSGPGSPDAPGTPTAPTP